MARKELLAILKKISYLNLLPIILISFVLYKVLNNPDSFLTVTWKVMRPFIWAFTIAYLLNPIMVYLERKFKLKRVWSILIVYIFFLGLLTLVFVSFTPRIITSITNLVKEIPDMDTIEKWLAYQRDRLEFLGQERIVDFIEQSLKDTLDRLSSALNPIINATLIKAINITSSLFNLIIGILISIYLLKDKEGYMRHGKRMVYASLNKEKAEHFIQYSREFNMLFSKYLTGKIFDSVIIGILCFIGTLIIGAPYALVISTIVGITNMVPYFGPFIGMVPATLITVFYSPIKALWVLIFIFALQQFDGLYLGPKILGTQVGMKPVWVISAIIIGGGLFGVVGMLLAVPVGAIIKTVLDRYISNRLKEKNIKL